jgi:hypothetical protein
LSGIAERPTQTLLPLWLGVWPRWIVLCDFQQIIQFFHQLVEGV